MQAINSNIIVKREPKVEIKGHIIIPEEYQKSPDIGQVVSIGDKVKGLSIGDYVYLSDIDGLILDNKENLWLYKYPEEVLCKIEQ
jgi:co-chaperonin GroES (HSP10)